MMEQMETSKKKKKLGEADYETAILERAIVKIGHLLALSFGEAGSRIIADNLNEGDLNPMMAGQRCQAIFLYADIKSFIPATEVLEESVLVFVN